MSDAASTERRVYVDIGNGKYEAYKIVSQPYVSKAIVERLKDGHQVCMRLTELLSVREVVELTKKRMEEMHDVYDNYKRGKYDVW